MNINKIKKLIDYLKASKMFDQTKYFHPCGTPACIAGHACIMEGYIRDNGSAFTRFSMVLKKGEYTSMSAEMAATKILELTYQQSQAAFSEAPYGYFEDLDDENWKIKPTTVDDAIAMLENLIETGEVEWGTNR